MKTLLLGLSLAGLVVAFAAPARADCQCVAAGKKYGVGEVACLRLPGGDRLARCSMVLNNSSWTPLQQSCPFAMADTEPVLSPQADMKAAATEVAAGHSRIVRK
ncbi:hypothetical protein [Mesorhizobium sp. Z1-4]|uniref:hypothetical protein n=1 Tax=Mesorhizobium sp. Z1-4 TaxID=2448478 RepID=UPI000FD71CD4|nr:hypothetical protein [Mesorhizobium sp. Z1-4]